MERNGEGLDMRVRRWEEEATGNELQHKFSFFSAVEIIIVVVVYARI